MFNLQTWVLIVLLSIGLLGSLIPNMPGSTLIFLGAVIYGWLDKFQHFSPWVLLILLFMTAGGAIGQYFITGLGAKKFGASRYGIIGAIIGLFVGIFFIPIVGGFLIGTFLGAVMAEGIFTLKNQREILEAGFGALLGTVGSLLFEFLISIVMITLITIVIWL